MGSTAISFLNPRHHSHYLCCRHDALLQGRWGGGSLVRKRKKGGLTELILVFFLKKIFFFFFHFYSTPPPPASKHKTLDVKRREALAELEKNDVLGFEDEESEE